jgi:hypothetical protein
MTQRANALRGLNALLSAVLQDKPELKDDD